jgi:hypothetical protein
MGSGVYRQEFPATMAARHGLAEVLHRHSQAAPTDGARLVKKRKRCHRAGNLRTTSIRTPRRASIGKRLVFCPGHRVKAIAFWQIAGHLPADWHFCAMSDKRAVLCPGHDHRSRRKGQPARDRVRALALGKSFELPQERRSCPHYAASCRRRLLGLDLQLHAVFARVLITLIGVLRLNAHRELQDA